MERIEIILFILSSIIGGLVVVFGWLITLGRKLQIVDDLKKRGYG